MSETDESGEILILGIVKGLVASGEKVRKAFEIKKIRKAQGWACRVIKIEDKKVRQKEVHSNRQMLLLN